MRHLRWVIGVAGLLIMGVSLWNIGSAMKRGPTVIEQDGFSYSVSTPIEFNLLPLLIGATGLGLVSWAIVKQSRK